MGKKGGSFWLTVVKKAFRSPSKEDKDKKMSRREETEQEEEEEEEKKREKRRWLFRRSTNNNIQPCEEKEGTITPPSINPNLVAEERHANAVAAATPAAAVEIIQLSTRTPPSKSVRRHYAAIIIQSSFRGYLARRALRALKGIVKLQALVRGHNVRRQAKMTLKCMQALLRVQARVRDQRARLSQEGGRKSMFADTTTIWEPRFMHDVRERKSMHSRDGSGNLMDDYWNDCPRTLQDLDAILQRRKEAALNREKTLAQAFSQQKWYSGRNPSAGDENELDKRSVWLDRWMATKQWESSRSSADRRETVNNLEVDTSRPYCNSGPNVGRPQPQSHHQQQPSTRSLASPTRKVSYPQPPFTPSLPNMKQLQVSSVSPRCPREERSYSTANTPNLGSARGLNGAGCASVPNYMAATESVKARLRSQSATRQRPSTPERERGCSAKKCLSYLVPETYSSIGSGCNSFSQNLRSPSFKSVQAGLVGMERGSNLSSCYTDSIGGEISPCSTTDLRKLLR